MPFLASIVPFSDAFATWRSLYALSVTLPWVAFTVLALASSMSLLGSPATAAQLPGIHPSFAA